MSVKDFDVNNPDLKNVDSKTLEFHQKVYNKMCENLGLDPSRGQIILERTPDDDTAEDDNIKINKAENKAIIGKDEFESYKKFLKDLSIREYRKINIESQNLNTQKQIQTVLEMILQIENVIADYLKILMD